MELALLNTSRSQKYQEKVKYSVCKKTFNSDYKDKRSETMHKEEKAKHSYLTAESG